MHFLDDLFPSPSKHQQDDKFIKSELIICKGITKSPRPIELFQKGERLAKRERIQAKGGEIISVNSKFAKAFKSPEAKPAKKEGGCVILVNVNKYSGRKRNADGAKLFSGDVAKSDEETVDRAVSAMSFHELQARFCKNRDEPFRRMSEVDGGLKRSRDPTDDDLENVERYIYFTNELNNQKCEDDQSCSQGKYSTERLIKTRNYSSSKNFEVQKKNSSVERVKLQKDDYLKSYVAQQKAAFKSKLDNAIRKNILLKIPADTSQHVSNKIPAKNITNKTATHLKPSKTSVTNVQNFNCKTDTAPLSNLFKNSARPSKIPEINKPARKKPTPVEIREIAPTDISQALRNTSKIDNKIKEVKSSQGDIVHLTITKLPSDRKRMHSSNAKASPNQTENVSTASNSSALTDARKKLQDYTSKQMKSFEDNGKKVPDVTTLHLLHTAVRMQEETEPARVKKNNAHRTRAKRYAKIAENESLTSNYSTSLSESASISFGDVRKPTQTQGSLDCDELLRKLSNITFRGSDFYVPLVQNVAGYPKLEFDSNFRLHSKIYLTTSEKDLYTLDFI